MSQLRLATSDRGETAMVFALDNNQANGKQSLIHLEHVGDGSPGGSWCSAGGGSGYANTSLVSSITASNAGSAGSANSTAEGDANWATGIGSPVAGDNDGGHGRVVLIY